MWSTILFMIYIYIVVYIYYASQSVSRVGLPMCDYSVLVGKYFVMLNAPVLVVFVVVYLLCTTSLSHDPFSSLFWRSFGDGSCRDRAGFFPGFHTKNERFSLTLLVFLWTVCWSIHRKPFSLSLLVGRHVSFFLRAKELSKLPNVRRFYFILDLYRQTSEERLFSLMGRARRLDTNRCTCGKIACDLSFSLPSLPFRYCTVFRTVAFALAFKDIFIGTPNLLGRKRGWLCVVLVVELFVRA